MSSFYSINILETTDYEASSEISLDSSHAIFAGHFPGMPILPGACMVQLTHELLDRFVNQKTIFLKANQIKFLQMVNPNTTKSLKSELKIGQPNGDQLKVEHVLSNEEAPVFKFSGLYKLTAT